MTSETVFSALARACRAVFACGWPFAAAAPTANAHPQAAGGGEVTALSSESSAARAAADDVAGWVGRPAPAVEGVTLADGKPWTLASQRGKVVVFHLWGSWCPVCMQEMLDDKRLEQRVRERQGVVFIGLPINDPPENTRRAVARHAVPWTQVLESSQHPERGFLALLRLRKLSVPQFWVVDTEGRIRGANLSLSETSALLARLAASSDASRRH